MSWFSAGYLCVPTTVVIAGHHLMMVGFIDLRLNGNSLTGLSRIEVVCWKLGNSRRQDRCYIVEDVSFIECKSYLILFWHANVWRRLVVLTACDAALLHLAMQSTA